MLDKDKNVVAGTGMGRVKVGKLNPDSWQDSDEEDYVPPSPPPNTLRPIARPSGRRQKSGRSLNFYLLCFSIGVIGALILWYLTGLVSIWWQTTQDNIHYGYPRTYQ